MKFSMQKMLYIHAKNLWCIYLHIFVFDLTDKLA
jgi:hypothetical protein